MMGMEILGSGEELFEEQQLNLVGDGCVGMKATSQMCFGAACGRDRMRRCFFQERFGEGSSGIDIAIVDRCRAPSTEVTPAFVRHSHCLYLTCKYFETFLVFISSRELKTNHVSMI